MRAVPTARSQILDGQLSSPSCERFQRSVKQRGVRLTLPSMLHHSNVDRLIAMWQAIYYNASTMNTTGVSHGTFGTKEGSTVDVDTPLKPFFDNKLNYYTSRTASRIKDFGYTYPEINDWSTSPDELAAYVTSRVNDLYGQGLDSGPRSGPRRRAKSSSQQPVAYSAEIRVERSDVPLPCTIDLRLGYHVLGRMSLLSMPTGGMSYTSVPLGEALRRLNLGDMPEDTLLPYLQQNLEVEVRKVRLPGLAIGCYGAGSGLVSFS